MNNPDHQFMRPSKPLSDGPGLITVPPYELIAPSPLFVYLKTNDVLDTKSMSSVLSKPYYVVSPCFLTDPDTLRQSALLNVNEFLWTLFNKTVKVNVIRILAKLEFMPDSLLANKQLQLTIEVDYGSLESLVSIPDTFKTLVFPIIPNIDIQTYLSITESMLKNPKTLSLEYTQAPRTVLSAGSAALKLDNMNPFRKSSFSLKQKSAQ